MKKVNTSDRLKQIMRDRGLRQVDILNMAEPFCKKYNVKLAKNDLSQYVSGKVVPGQWKLTVLGMALGVSEAWLMGYDVPIDRGELGESTPVLPQTLQNEENQRDKDPSTSDKLPDKIDPLDREIIETLRTLNPEYKRIALAQLAALVDAAKNKDT